MVRIVAGNKSSRVPQKGSYLLMGNMLYVRP